MTAGAADPFAFHGKVAIVAGSTRGIGLATARMIAARGGRVVISSRKPDACEAVCAELCAEGLDAIAVPAHIGKAGDCEALIAGTLDRCGRIDVLVANAAINPVFAPLAGLDAASWEKVMDTNVAGPWRLACAALPAIAANQDGGALVLLSSVNGRLGVPRSGAYGISKAAVEQMTRQLAVEWGPRNIRVNAVAPGTTRTDMIRALADDGGFVTAIERRTPLGRLGEPEDVAAAITFLASDAARQITGQVLTVDGGATIAWL